MPRWFEAGIGSGQSIVLFHTAATSHTGGQPDVIVPKQDRNFPAIPQVSGPHRSSEPNTEVLPIGNVDRFSKRAACGLDLLHDFTPLRLVGTFL